MATNSASSEPWQYFWLTGGLSAFLDNAPTYLTFATVASGPGRLDRLMLSNRTSSRP